MPKGVYPHTHIKKKAYPPDMVNTVRRMYADGSSQDEIAKALDVTQKVVWRLMVNHAIPRRAPVKRDQRAEKNDSWRGSGATYAAFHHRVEVARGKPRLCGRCETTDATRYEWANLTGDYADIADYERMCVPCHRRFDIARRRAGQHYETPSRSARG